MANKSNIKSYSRSTPGKEVGVGRYHTSKQILRKEVTEYQKTRSKIVFGRILKRVDGLVIYVISGLQNQSSYYKSIGFDELYQTAIVGVGEAALTVKEIEDGDKVIARIISYIKAAIRRTFKCPRKILGKGLPKEHLSEMSKESPDKLVDLVDFCQIEVYPYLSDEERDLLHKRFVENKIYREIGKELNCSKAVARLRVLKILKRFRLLDHYLFN